MTHTRLDRWGWLGASFALIGAGVVGGALAPSRPATPEPARNEIQDFWRMIDRIGIGQNAAERATLLKMQLASMNDDELRGFVRHFVDRLGHLDHPTLERAAEDAYGCDDVSCLASLRTGLVLLGGPEYRRVVRNPSVLETLGRRDELFDWDATDTLTRVWRMRFDDEPYPSPHRLGLARPAPAEPREDQDTGIVWSRRTDHPRPSAPHSVPSFCTPTSAKVPPARGGASELECEQVSSESPADDPTIHPPVALDDLCLALAEHPATIAMRSDALDRCTRDAELHDGFAIYVVGPASEETQYLVRERRGTATILASLGGFFSGDGYAYDTRVDDSLRTDASGVELYWRVVHTDWNVGVDEYLASEQCMGIRCEPIDDGYVCSEPRLLLGRGGAYHVVPNESWYDPGEPHEEWACRAR